MVLEISQSLSTGSYTPSLYIEHLENFITEVVADFDGAFACRAAGRHTLCDPVRFSWK